MEQGRELMAQVGLQLLLAVNDIANTLLAARDPLQRMEEILRRLGQAADISRVHIFRKHEVDGRQCVSLAFEWSDEGVPSRLGDPRMQEVDLERSGFAMWCQLLSSGEIVQGELTDFSESEKTLLETLGVVSLLLVPITVEKRLWGIIGFENCTSPRPWSPVEVAALRMVAACISSAIGMSRQLDTLEEMDKRMRAMSDASSEAIFLSEAGICLGQNLTAREMFGYTDEEAIGRPGTEWITPQDREKVIRSMGEGLEGPYEVTAVRKDGTTFPCRIQARSIDYGGRTMRVTALQDISASVSAMKALRDSEKRNRETLDLFRLMADNMSDMLWAKDMEGRYIFANRAICEKLLDAENTDEPLGLTDMFFTERIRSKRPEDTEWHTFGDLCMDSDAVVMEEREPRRFDEFGNVMGDFMFLNVHKAPILDEDGNILGIVGSAREVTREKELEFEQHENMEALRKSEMMLSEAQQLAGMGSWTRNRRTEERTWSDEMFRITGLGTQTVTPEMVNSIIHPDDRDPYWEKVERAETASDKMMDHDFRLVRPDGEERHMNIRIRFEYDEEGKPLYQSGILHDITWRSEMQREKLRLERQMQQAQKLESLGVLAGGIAHDFNNILMGILGSADLALLDLEQGSPVYSKLLDIIRNSQHAAALSNQMLAYSGVASFSMEPVDISTLVISIGHLLGSSISKSVSIEVEDVEKPLYCVGDATQLRQVVMNLALNAAEAYADDSGHVMLRTGSGVFDEEYLSGTITACWKEPESPPAPGQHVWLEVCDYGCGMTEETMQRMFDPFFTTKFTGRGLGMAAVLGIVRSHEGAIRVYSQLGLGSTFRVLFPETAQRPETDTAPSEEAPDPPEGGAVLLVDDEPMVRETVGMMLEHLGYQVVTAADGMEALDLLKRDPLMFCCAILDLTMPHMSGEECLVELRQVRPDLKVIISSGFTQDEIADRFRNEDISAFIQKPYVLDTLRKTLGRI